MQDVVLDKIKSNLMESKEEECKIDKSLFTERELSIIALIAKGFSNKRNLEATFHIRRNNCKLYYVSFRENWTGTSYTNRDLLFNRESRLKIWNFG